MEDPEGAVTVMAIIRLAVTGEDDIAGYGLRDGFRCRRCKQVIPEGGVLHFVKRRESELPELGRLRELLGVCGGCVGVGERGYLGDGDLGRDFSMPMPEMVLTDGEWLTLKAAAQRRVYRLPKCTYRMRDGVPSSSNDTAVTRAASALVTLGLVSWEYVSVGERRERQPLGWMVLTDAGRAYLESRGVTVGGQ